MENESKLSGGSNMALGFFPLIVTMLLGEMTSADNAVYAGTGVGLFLSIMHHTLHKPQTTHFILYSSTVVLGLFCFVMLMTGGENKWLQKFLPLLLETAVTLPLLFLYFNRRKYPLIAYKRKEGKGMNEQIHATILTISCIRVFFTLVTFHCILILTGLLATRSLDNSFMWFVLCIAPILVFATNILIGFVEIIILRTIKSPEFVPIVTPSGGVIGKVNKEQAAAEYRTSHTYPVIRIAVVSHHMLFLSKRSSQRILDKGKIDTPLETYLLFREDIKSGVERLLKETFPRDWHKLNPHFSIKYRFKSEETNRLVYLFVLDLGVDDAVLCDPQFECGKLWTFKQIEDNLGRHYFGEMFENEYEHLKVVIETRGKYKES